MLVLQYKTTQESKLNQAPFAAILRAAVWNNSGLQLELTAGWAGVTAAQATTNGIAADYQINFWKIGQIWCSTWLRGGEGQKLAQKGKWSILHLWVLWVIWQYKTNGNIVRKIFMLH